MASKKVKEIISTLTDEQLREAIEQLDYTVWEDDAYLRELAREAYGEDNVLTMLGLAVPLALELNKRTKL
jgi:predicted transcriptional regulator with HTH domain